MIAAASVAGNQDKRHPRKGPAVDAPAGFSAIKRQGDGPMRRAADDDGSGAAASARLAAALALARRGGPLVRGPAPRDMPEALAAQAHTVALLGPALGGVGGWKTGRGEPGAAPAMAPILAATLRPSPARFRLAEARLRGVELEIAFRLDDAPPPPGAPDFARLMRERVSVAAAIEVVDARIAGGADADPLLKLADLQINAGLATGPARGDWGALDAATVRLEIGGVMAVQGPRPTPGGDAFATFCAFARRVGAHCGGLCAGQWVTTGSLTGLLWAPPGATAHGEIAGLGAVSVTFTD